MPRNSSGAYSLYTPGNPVVTQTVISSSWANNTLSDLATAMTDSLSRSGDGGMLAGLELANGTSGAPGLSWGSDLTSGLYRAGASDFRWVNATVELLQLTTNLFQVSGTAPVVRINESDAAANNRLWDVIASGEDLNFRALTDALAATNWLTVARTAGTVDSLAFAATAASFNGTFTFSKVNTTFGTAPIVLASNSPAIEWQESDGAANNKNWSWYVAGEQMVFDILTDAFARTNWLVVDRTAGTVDTVNFPNGTLQYGGIEVGYRGFRQRRNITGNDNTAATDAGGILVYTSSGHTLTFDSDPAQESLITVVNAGSGNLTIAASGSLSWFNGSGTIGSGSRTLAVAGAVSLWHSGSGAWNMWGTGVT